MGWVLQASLMIDALTIAKTALNVHFVDETSATLPINLKVTSTALEDSIGKFKPKILYVPNPGFVRIDGMYFQQNSELLNIVFLQSTVAERHVIGTTRMAKMVQDIPKPLWLPFKVSTM